MYRKFVVILMLVILLLLVSCANREAVVGKAGEVDADGDGVADSVDNCALSNPDQLDTDNDGNGDLCDIDDDNDGVCDPNIAHPDCGRDSNGLFIVDNCPFDSNPDQLDSDGDDLGNVCDTCTDADGDGFGVDFMGSGMGISTCASSTFVADGCPQDAAPSSADGCPGEAGLGDFSITAIDIAGQMVFEEGSAIPAQYACSYDINDPSSVTGYGINPAFRFGNVPDGTVSFAVTMEDTAISALHWLAWNIPVTEGILENHANGVQGIPYVGPCPPPGESHLYEFTVYAVSGMMAADKTSEQVLADLAASIWPSARVVGSYAAVESNTGGVGGSPDDGAVGGRCIGTVLFDYAELCSGDDSNIGVDTEKVLVSSCTERKCEYRCSRGYTLREGECQEAKVAFVDTIEHELTRVEPGATVQETQLRKLDFLQRLRIHLRILFASWA